jgi:putative Mg2+ transporter-C (MgtC) family protein
MIYAFAVSSTLAVPESFSQEVARLLLAAVLGGLIGFERQIKRRPAGLRTNMLICFGAALFTLLSGELASAFGGDKTRIASQIIPGIGFIGAGSILRDRGSVTGLTTAATIFAVASVGMACGGGMYLLAIVSTVLIVLCLVVLGSLETQFNLKAVLMHYSIVSDHPTDEMLEQVNAVLDEREKQMQGMRISRLDGKKKVLFSVEGTNSEHKELLERLRHYTGIDDITSSPERDVE